MSDIQNQILERFLGFYDLAQSTDPAVVMIRNAWAEMDFLQRKIFIQRGTEKPHPACCEDVDHEISKLLKAMDDHIEDAEIAISDAGYFITQDNQSFFWTDPDDDSSEDYGIREDAIMGAYQHFLENQNTTSVEKPSAA